MTEKLNNTKSQSLTDPKAEIKQRIATLREGLTDVYAGPMDTELPGAGIRREISELEKQLGNLT